MKNFLIKMLWSFKKNFTNPNEQQGLAKHDKIDKVKSWHAG